MSNEAEPTLLAAIVEMQGTADLHDELSRNTRQGCKPHIAARHARKAACLRVLIAAARRSIDDGK